MQQTEKYKLNLIESSDPFLPEGLNQNTQKIEDAMEAHEEKVDGQVADLDARVKVFEAKHFATGICSMSERTALPFTPTLVLIVSWSSMYSSMAITGHNTDSLVLEENGFHITGKIGQYSGCTYIALG